MYGYLALIRVQIYISLLKSPRAKSCLEFGIYLHLNKPCICIDSWPRVGLDCQKWSRSGLRSKLPDMRSVDGTAILH